ncbi:MAG: glycosyltransferase [Bacteroidales bacterium]|jgi:glycosyltransferase involved in cell wall biosynthesis
MIRNRDIVIISIQPWDVEIGGNGKNIAIEFHRFNRVLYVNPPLDRISRLKERKDQKIKKRIRIRKGTDPDLVQIDDQLWTLYPKVLVESINWIGLPWIYDLFNKRNNRLFAKDIQIAVSRLGFNNFILFNDSSMFLGYYLKELLTPEIYLYYTRDNLIAVDYWKRQGVRLEAELMNKVDLVVANSTYLASQARKFNRNSYYVGQGCDGSLFDSKLVTSVPADIDKITKPIIGYIGVLFSLRLDIEVIEYIAENRPDWSIVLIGPEDDNFKNSRLHQLKNVYFLGTKPMPELPSYLSQFDVAINPQILNPVTIGNYPRKIDEYLAMGKPTVATKTEAMSAFAEFTYLAENKEEYGLLIEKALEEDNDMAHIKREQFAHEHTWENNIREIYKAIQSSKI